MYVKLHILVSDKADIQPIFYREVHINYLL